MYYIIGSTLIVALFTFITMDLTVYGNNMAYASYTNVFYTFLLYIVLSMYVILKKLSVFPSGKIYKRYFVGITGISSLLLVVCSMILGSAIIDEEDVVPLLFTLLLIITLLCISIYRKVIGILEENMLTKIEVEKNAIQQDYYTHVQESLNTLSLLRHDFKNHLLVIQSHASSGQIDELNNYLNRLYEEFVPTILISTPSSLLSALLNAKDEECKRKGVSLILQQNFNNIYFDDFHLVTIFSNLLDNAITAAVKCHNGEVLLKLTTIDSYLDIDCTNTHQEVITTKENRFISTKNSSNEFHGLGIISMQKAVESLGGEITIDYTDDTFHVNILVPNYQ